MTLAPHRRFKDFLASTIYTLGLKMLIFPRKFIQKLPQKVTQQKSASFFWVHHKHQPLHGKIGRQVASPLVIFGVSPIF